MLSSLFLFISFRSVFCRDQRFFLLNLITPDTVISQENTVECVCQRLQGLFLPLRLQLAFPDCDAVPAHRGQFMLHSPVPLLVLPYLCHPKITIRLRYLAALRTFNFQLQTFNWWHRHPMSVPEAAIHKDTSAILPHHDVGLPW